jgi:hypothetical protein
MSGDYTLHLIAFVDTLGYKETFPRPCGSDKNHFSCAPNIWGTEECNACLKEQRNFRDRFFRLSKKIVEEMNGFDANNIRLVTFSDNFLFALPLETRHLVAIIDQDLYKFLEIIRAIQVYMLKNEFIPRGGVDVGLLEISDDSRLVFGKGLVSVVHLEGYDEKRIRPPRINLSDYIGQHCLRSDRELLRGCVENDNGAYFLNFKSSTEKYAGKLGVENIRQFVSGCRERITDESVKKKYIWLEDYLGND